MSAVVLFVMHGDSRGVNFKLQRLVKMKYVSKEMCFTDLNYLSDGNARHFRGRACTSAVVVVTDIEDAGHKSSVIQRTMRGVFDSVVVVEVEGSIGRIQSDEEFRRSVDVGIQLSDTRLSTEDRLELLVSLRKASRKLYSSV